MNINFLDTSAILNGELKNCFQKTYISPITLMELQNIKTSDRNEYIKYRAREAIRDIITFTNVAIETPPQKNVDKLLKRHTFLSDINDHKIICEASLLAAQTSHQVVFITYDAAQSLFARRMGNLKVKYINTNAVENNNEDYCGWGKYYPNEEEMILLYSNPKMNVLNCKINEYAEIYQGQELKDILRWDGEQYKKLNYKEFTTTLGEKIKPRNLEQKMYLDLLQNHDVPVKLCTAKFGTGKSYLALSYALNEIQKGRFEKIIFVKNNLEVKGAGTLGTLPGDEVEKMYPWLRQIEDHIGIQKFEEYLDTGIIQPAHLSTLRGRDLKNCIILVDEAENLLATNIQLLIGRVAENSEIIFCADIKQCDYRNEKESGIPKMIESFAGNKLFGMVKLLKTERSAIAAMADLMD